MEKHAAWPEVTVEGQDALTRYNILIHNGQEYLNGTALVEDKPWSQDDVAQVKRFLIASAPFAHPKVNPSYWEHIILAGIYARLLAERTNHPDINPYEAQSLLLLNDLGRFAVPHHYLRNDLVYDRLAKGIGIREDFMGKLPSMFHILGIGPNPFQTLQDVPEVQRITDVADNIGKNGADGQLFDIESMLAYDSAQPTRYIPNSPWPSENRGRKALTEEGKQKFAIDNLLQEIQWLKDTFSINFDQLREEVKEEFEGFENQEFLIALKDAHETLDTQTDRLLGRPPIEVVVFDVGDVLFTRDGEKIDNEIIRRMSSFFNCEGDVILHAFSELHIPGTTGSISEKEYLRRFWGLAGKNPPLTIEALREPFIHPDIYQPNPKMQELIQKLAQNPNIRIFLFSNVVPPLTPVTEKRLRECCPQLDIDNCYLASSRAGFGKGIDNSTAFSYLLEKAKASNPQAVLFIDDNESHCVAARSLFAIRGFTFRENPYKNLTAEERLEAELQKAEII